MFQYLRLSWNFNNHKVTFKIMVVLVRVDRVDCDILLYFNIIFKLNFLREFGHGLVQLNSPRLCHIRWIMTAIVMQIWTLFKFVMEKECCKLEYTTFNIKHNPHCQIQVVNASGQTFSLRNNAFYLRLGCIKCFWLSIFSTKYWRLRINRKETVEIFT
jgi:hypothetical protein